MADLNGKMRPDPYFSEKDRQAEYGVVGAAQTDESHFDQRSPILNNEFDEDNYHKNENGENSGRLRFASRKLYGRESELARCHALFHRHNNQENGHPNNGNLENDQPSGRPAVAFVAGYSGCGKSTLVEYFVNTLRQQQQPHLFLHAKYSVLQKEAPFGAFQNLLDHVDARTNRELSLLKEPLQQAMGDEASILHRIFPGLKQTDLGLESNTDDCDSSVGSASESLSGPILPRSMGSLPSSSGARTKKLDKERIKFALLSFFRGLSTRERPLILFIDDLQWADAPSLFFLKTLLTDTTLPHLVFFGAYRANEVSEGHALWQVLDHLENSATGSGGTTERLELKELAESDIGEFIADTLRLSTTEVAPLTQAVFHKTLGNIFFTKQALEQLIRKNALYYDTISFSWAWNLKRPELEDLLSDDILEMVKSKISHLDEELQGALIAASCTRSTFDVDTLVYLLHHQRGMPSFNRSQTSVVGSREMSGEYKSGEYRSFKRHLVALLSEAVQEGLLVQKPKPHSGEYSFAHDRIEEAAFGLITEDERDAFLQRIGSQLYLRAKSSKGEDWMYFSAARHLNDVATRITLDETMLIQLAVLNLRTAELSSEVSAFLSTIESCHTGLRYLPHDKWKMEYKLTLALYTLLAEAEHGVGNFEQAEKHCDEILKQKPSTMYDVIPAYKVHLNILNGKGENAKALDLCLAILEEFGINFPKNPKMQRVRAWNSIRQIQARHIPTEESVRDMPEVTDPNIRDTLDILQKASGFAYVMDFDRPSLYVLICCESVRLISMHGLTETSASSLASFANILMHVYQDFDTSTRLAELSVFITDRLKNKFTEARALNSSNHMVLGWVRPLRTRMPYHLRAYESGTTSGNIEGAAVAKWHTYFVQMFAGMPLAALEADCRVTIPKLRAMGLTFFANLCVIAWQMSLNLMGRSENTTLLVGEAMDETKPPYTKTPFKEAKNAWKRLAYIMFGEFEEGAEDALDAGDFYNKRFVGLMYGLEGVSRAVSLYAMARKGQSKYKKSAKRKLKDLKDLVKKGCVNLQGPTRMLEAEDAAMAGKQSQARYFFEDAIGICRKGEYHHYEGLACERFATFLLEMGDYPGYAEKLGLAIECYSRWGATRKVESLKSQISPKPETVPRPLC